MGAELFLPWTPSNLPDAMGKVIEVFLAQGLLRRSAQPERLAAPDPNSQEFAELHLLGETVRPTLERHFLTLALLQRYGSGSQSRRTLEGACHLLAQRLSLLYEINTPEFSNWICCRKMKPVCCILTGALPRRWRMPSWCSRSKHGKPFDVWPVRGRWRAHNCKLQC
ncbi:hypothetical protein JZU54_03840 [bacterium]|nr:hypothetical protein [bacterium]